MAVSAIGPSAQYLVHERIAVGGMGEVFRGTMDGQAGRRPIAIKQLSPERIRDPDALERLVAEARLGFRLTHGNICQVLDLVLDERGAFLVLEYVDGLDLRNFARRVWARDQELQPAVVLYVGREVARALDFAHSLRGDAGQPMSVIHGDVAPPNILLSISGEVKLADFGIARALGTVAPGSDVVGGTVGFMAPEVDSGVIDARTDVYALGAVLHHCLAGQPPPVAGDVELLRQRGDVAREVVALVERAIDPDIGRRFSSAGELEAALAFELARRHPSFVASGVGGLVRLVKPDERAEPNAAEATLFSLPFSQMSTEAARPLLTGGGLAMTNAGENAPVGLHRTMTVAPDIGSGRRRRRRRLAIALLTVTGAIALALSVRYALLEWRQGGAETIAAPPLVEQAAATTIGAAPMTDAAPMTAAAPAPVDAGAARPPARPVARPRPRPPTRPGREPSPRTTEVDTSVARTSYLSVNAEPWGAVEVDGVVLARETPVYRIPVAPGKRSVRVIFGDGKPSRPRVVELRAGVETSLGFKR